MPYGSSEPGYEEWCKKDNKTWIIGEDHREWPINGKDWKYVVYN
jgi:hypothetical protein